MELSAILKGINQKRNEMIKRNAKNSPPVMNDIMLELTQLYHLLGERIADEWLAMKQFRANKFHEFRESGMSSSAAEAEVKMDLECIEKEADYRRLEAIDKRTSMLITSSQSHLKHKAAEIRDQV